MSSDLRPVQPFILSRDLVWSFWSRVPMGAHGCWEWQGSTAKGCGGYGVFEHRRVRYFAHRAAYFLKTRRQPHLCVCHHCDNPRCVRPSHLFLGSRTDNAADRDRKGRGVYLRGNASGMAKLRAVQIPQIRSLLADGVSLAEIGTRFGVHGETIGAIRDGKTWRHIPSSDEV